MISALSPGITVADDGMRHAGAAAQQASSRESGLARRVWGARGVASSSRESGLDELTKLREPRVNPAFMRSSRHGLRKRNPLALAPDSAIRGP